MQNHYETIAPSTVKIIDCETRRLVGSYGFNEHDLPDMQQDLHLHVWRRTCGWAIAREVQPAFVRRIVKNKIRDLISGRTAECRDVRKNGWSLDEPVPGESDESGEVRTMEKVMDCAALLNRFGGCSPDSPRLRDLRIDLAAAAGRMPRDHARVFSALHQHGGNILSAGRDLNLTRKGMAASLDRIREFLAPGNKIESSGTINLPMPFGNIAHDKSGERKTKPNRKQDAKTFTAIPQNQISDPYAEAAWSISREVSQSRNTKEVKN